MGVHLTEYDMARLVEIYKDYECLWNVHHELYRANEARQAAYQEILQKLDIKYLTVKDIPNKIKNLRSSYYQEIKRMKRNARTGGKMCEPKVSWFPRLDEFLRPFRNERSYIGKKPVTRPVKSKKENSDKNKIAVKEKIAERIAPRMNLNEEDEFDSFGIYIANSLRSMTPEFSIIAKTELQKTISEIQLRMVRKNNQSSYYSTSSDNENQHAGCVTPSSDSCLSIIKIEYNE